MSRLFDTIVMVDWSAQSKPSPKKPKKDAIWWSVSRDGNGLEPTYARTRAEAARRLADFAAAERSSGRRLLIGWDFPFGWPQGVAEAITGRAEAFALWRWLTDRIEDDDENRNNHFGVSETMNARFPGVGPFWGKTHRERWPGTPYRKWDRARTDLHPPERRRMELRAPRTKSCFQLAYSGCVGSQALLGVPVLERLRQDERLAGAIEVWPLDRGFTRPCEAVILAEIYPGLIEPEVRAAVARTREIKDAAQVRLLAGAFAALDAEGRLAELFRAPEAPALTPDERTIVEREEAWLLGLGHEEALRAAAAGVGMRAAA